jgi:hypothetical protein
MKLLGQLEVAEFVRMHSGEMEVLSAWVSEIRHRRWNDSLSLITDFQSADADQPPRAVFKLGPTPVFVETVIDYRTSVVLVTRLSFSDLTIGRA